MTGSRTKNQSRSALSRLNFDAGPGFLPDIRRINSMSRSKKALTYIYGGSIKDSDHLKPLMSDNFCAGNDLIAAINWYWWYFDVDQGTTDAILKNDLEQVIRIMKLLAPAMKQVPTKTRQVVDQTIRQSQVRLSSVKPEFDILIATVEEIVLAFEPVVENKYVRKPGTAIPNTCKLLMHLWSKIMHKKFTRSNVHFASHRLPILVKDECEFKNDGMHFLHVTLQAIDPTISFSQILSSVQSLGKRRSE